MTRVTYVDTNGIRQRGRLVSVYETRNCLFTEVMAVIEIGHGKSFVLIPLSEISSNESNQ